MKTLSKEQLIEESQNVFGRYPEAEQVFARADGNIFFEEHHARINQGDMKVYSFKRDDIGANEIPVVSAEILTSDKTPVKKAGAPKATAQTPAQKADATKKANAEKKAEETAAKAKAVQDKKELDAAKAEDDKEGNSPEDQTNKK